MDPIATMRILWAALLSSVGLFAAVIVILPPAEATPEPVHLFMFAAVAVGSAAASFFIPRLAHANAVKAAALETHAIPDPDAPSGFAAVRRVQVFKDPAQARRHALRLYQVYMIIGCALSESVAMLGVVLDRLGHPQLTTLPFVLAGMVLVALRYPVESKGLELFQGVANARLH